MPHNFAPGNVRVALSGLAGCGKDSLVTVDSESSFETIWELWGLEAPPSLALGQIIRHEVQKFLFDLKTFSLDEACGAYGFVNPESIDEAFSAMTQEEIDGCDPWVRSPGMRVLLQNVGLGAVSPDHWNKILSKRLDELSTEPYLQSAGVRKINEADLFRSHGFKIVRIDVSIETCMGRIGSRDGFAPDRESFLKPAETQLDNYDFDAVIDGEQPFDAVRDSLAQYLESVGV